MDFLKSSMASRIPQNKSLIPLDCGEAKEKKAHGLELVFCWFQYSRMVMAGSF
jgi:hypothetical protein